MNFKFKLGKVYFLIAVIKEKPTLKKGISRFYTIEDLHNYRGRGLIWSEISELFGGSRQAAQQFYKNNIDKLDK